MVTLPIRLFTASALVLLADGIAVAQLPEAPPPHPPFRELVKEYQRLGLPLPPPDAKLVRINWWLSHRASPYIIGFRIRPKEPGTNATYLIGDGSWMPREVTADQLELADPIPDSLTQVHLGMEELLAFAIQCKLRGWDELAQAAYSRTLAEWAESEPDCSLLVELRYLSWFEWREKLMRCGSNRKEVLHHLRALAEEEETLLTPERERFLSRLESTVNHPRTKPGTVEALIDDLTEYCFDPYDQSAVRHDEPYWKVAGLGFDAIPALIDHLGDDRLSRASSRGFNNFWPYTLTVGHLCSRLLFDLSGRTIHGGHWELRGDRLDPEKAREWFAEAKKIGEEKWLLDHALPKDDGDVTVDQEGRPERLIVRVIGAKYPARLPAIYRAILQKPPGGWLGDYVEEVVASKLPREQKSALLEEGVAHKEPLHRLWALEGLAALDADLFPKRLAEDLKKNPGDARLVTRLIQRTDNLECWDAFAAAAKRAPYEDRMVIINNIGYLDPPDKPDPIRRERVRFLAQFLDDRAAEKSESGDMVEVRDEAVSQLGGLLWFRVDYRFPDLIVQHDPNRGPITRFVFREVVRRAAGQELAHLKK